MKVNELREALDLTVAVEGDLDREVKGGYVCDLLSLVMARLKEGHVWITVQTNVNVVAVAALAECACVLIPEGMSVEQATLDKARGQGVTILQSQGSAFELAAAMAKRLEAKA